MPLTANQVQLLNHSINDGVWNSLPADIYPNPAHLQFGAVQKNTIASINSTIRGLSDADLASKVVPVLDAYYTVKMALISSELSPITAEQAAITPLNT